MAAKLTSLNTTLSRLSDSWANGRNFLEIYFLLCVLLRLHSPIQCADGVKPAVSHPVSRRSRKMSDQELLEAVQKRTFRYFWEYGHPVSGLARERTDMGFGKGEVVTMGGSGFGVMAIIVAAEREWIRREEAAERTDKILQFLGKADRFHGVFPHWMNGTSGKVIPFSKDDDGGDLVETSFLVQGLLCARQYFVRDSATETRIRESANRIWDEVEWTRHMLAGKDVLFWSDPHKEGVSHLEISGWNECLITYVLAASSGTYPIDDKAYHKGWARNGSFKNGKQFYGIPLPLGPDYGGPLFFAHYSFLGLNPRGLKDKYADYWEQNTNHTLINYEHCVRNPNKFKGYSGQCWGLTASSSPAGYTAHSPTRDVGTISPTAALSSLPYAREKSMKALRHFYEKMGNKIWGNYGITDAFNDGDNWYTKAYLAIDQGPIVVMMENLRTGLMWKLFMSCPEVRGGLKKLGFESPFIE